jgi:HK97 family phage prohead protease
MNTKRRAPEAPHRQTIRAPFEVRNVFGVEARADTDTSTLVRVEGVASVYDHRYDVYGGPANFGWVEQVARGAFDETLAEDPDVVFLLNHEGLPLARTRSGTLTLTAGKTGLEVSAELDRRDTDAGNLLVKMERGDIDEMSFAFRVTRQAWEAHPDHPDDEMSLRTIEAVNLNRGDVSAVTYGASDATTIDIVRSLQLANDVELDEYQAVIAGRLAARSEPSGGMPGGVTGGMPAHLAMLLHIPTNPTLERFTR